MRVRLALEKWLEGKRILVWGLDFPGCFSEGTDEAEAVLRFPQALLRHEAWVRLHTDDPWFRLGDLDFRIEESFTCHLKQNYEVNAFFTDDLRSLNAADCSHALAIYQWQREELQAGLETLEPDFLQTNFPGERWPVLGILQHLARAETWYLQCLGLRVAHAGSADPLEQLEQSALQVTASLPQWIGEARVTQSQGEYWSPRKVVRRLLWHQRDYIDHIRQLAERFRLV